LGFFVIDLWLHLLIFALLWN